MIRPLLLALTFALLIAAPAGAQAPIDLGPGQSPTLIVDASGTAHIVFVTAEGDVYCRMPRGARACDVRTVLGPPSGDGSRAILDRPDGTLALIRSTYESDDALGTRGRTYLRVSADRGLTWTPPAVIAYGSETLGAAELARDGQSLLTLQLDTREANFAQTPFTGGQTRVLNLHDDPNATVAWLDMTVLPDGRVLTAEGDLAVARWRLFGGGDAYDPNAWATRGTVRRVSNGELVSGPRGTFLFEHEPLANQRLGSFQAPFTFRSFDTRRARFRPGRVAAADRSIFGTSRALQDARGRLHVVADTPSGGAWTCVLYARTGPRRSSWFGKTTVLFRTTADARAPQNVRLGAAADGRGFALWHDTTNVWAMPLRQAKGAYRPRANQNDRPACTGNTYG
jgi:hypothetical protein